MTASWFLDNIYGEGHTIRSSPHMSFSVIYICGFIRFRVVHGMQGIQ
jgi:hypothetical protein